MSAQKAPAYTVYLLHFDELVGGKRHYIGITRSDRLERRMQEHCGEHASRLTARAAKAATGFKIARTWPADDHATEQRLKRAGHYDKRCPICQGHLDLDGTRSHYMPRTTTPPGGDWSAVAWSHRLPDRTR